MSRTELQITLVAAAVIAWSLIDRIKRWRNEANRQPAPVKKPAKASSAAVESPEPRPAPSVASPQEAGMRPADGRRAS